MMVKNAVKLVHIGAVQRGNSPKQKKYKLQRFIYVTTKTAQYANQKIFEAAVEV